MKTSGPELGEMERPLPQNLDAERSVLGAIMVDNKALDLVRSILETGDFLILEHGQIFKSMIALAMQNVPIDSTTMMEALAKSGELDVMGRVAYLEQLQDDVPRVSNFVHYARIVKEKAVLRSLIHAASSLMQQAMQHDAKPKELLQLLDLHSAHLRKEVLAESNSLFRTPIEIASEGSTSTEWIVPGLLAVGVSTELVGKVKASGKTTFLLGMVEAIVNRKLFLGHPTRQTPVVYLTEQPRASFCIALKRAGLERCDSLHVLHWHQVAGWNWPDVATLAISECKKRGAKLLIVDTIGQFAGIEGDSENDAGAAMQAMKPLQSATSEGIGVAVSRHERKSGGDLGESGRGSSAYAGSADILLSLRRPEGNSKTSLRVIRGVGRLDDIPDNLVIELTLQGFVSHGQVSDVAYLNAKKAILALLRDSEDEALSMKEILEAVDEKRTTVQRVMQDLRETGVVERCGKGKRGDSFRFFLSEKVSAQTPINSGQKESSPVEPETVDTF